MNAAPEVVVVGGGIGGLANAYALASAGRSVRVLERAAEFTEVGAGLQMAPNATRVLAEWGLLDEVLAAGVLPRRLVFKDMLDGSELIHLDFDDFTRRYGGPYVVIHRSDLLGILFGACVRAGVELVPSCAVTGVSASSESVVVHAAGDEHRAALAIAADGLRSKLRGKFSADEPVCSGYVAYRGTVPVSELGQDVDSDARTDVVIYIGPGCHLVHYPLRQGEIFNTVAVFSSPAYRGGADEWGGPEELDRAFSDACPTAKAGLRMLWRDRRWPMYDRLPIPQWTRDRLVLSGDAAHPMLQYLAQGACQAIEDAHCLAGEAGKSPDWDVAIRRYEAERTARTAQVQANARIWGDIWHVDGVGRLIRNELFRTLGDRKYTYVDWLYGR
ncbi:salicylate hydroxylase [Kibdelosporangium banguiense]|uniref:Salicylate hydroxylase n=1 Tax=Kibdelosporangium banguiense TaxID=1365924 RepID=A0ABS4TRF6_9PSEU|nr:FAD-dependent monooxygenase [Kibdelosporangium banguiense]MBP2327004.1 salicylate hydroxylase [Kibdelosporangium banguiense]